MTFLLIKSKRMAAPVKKKTEESQRVLDKLQEYLDEAEEGMVRFLENFWVDQALVLTYAELRAIVLEEDLPGTIMDAWRKDYAKLVASKLTSAWKAAVEAGIRSNPILDGMKVDSGKLAREWIVNRSAKLVTDMLDEQIKAIRYVLGESVSYKMGSAETAQYIRPIVGLTERQVEANMKYYNNMKAKLAEEHPRMKVETVERKAREAAAKYASKQHRTRAETIARTEIVTAYHEGNDQAIREGIRNGVFPKMRKEWSTSRDTKVCPSCMTLKGVVIDMDAEFTAKSGRRTVTTSIPPLHPRCACAIKYVEE